MAGYGQYSQAGSFGRRNPLAGVAKQKRQRQVYPTTEIPHLWAHKTQASARNPQGNLYFDGDTIYSYGDHFPIAQHVTNASGKTAVLLTTRGYSNTTAQHISAVRSAIPENVQVFHVEPFRGQNTENLLAYRTQFREQIAKLEQTRSLRMWKFRAKELEAKRAEILAYGRFFRVKVGELPKVPKLDAARKAKLLAFDAAQTERENRKRELNRARWDERERINALNEQERIAEWRNGADISLYHVPTMLRIKGTVVETSRGARVPIEHAKRALRFVRAVMARGTEYQRNGHTEHVGHYTIDRVTPDGTLYAGCHVITWAEIEQIAPELER